MSEYHGDIPMRQLRTSKMFKIFPVRSKSGKILWCEKVVCEQLEVYSLGGDFSYPREYYTPAEHTWKLMNNE